MVRYFTALLSTFIVTLKICTAQTHYGSFKIQENAYGFYLAKDQALTSSYLEFNESAHELWRSVKFPKEHIEVFNTNTGKLKRKIFPHGNKCNVFKRLDNGNIWIQDEDFGFKLIDKNGKLLKKIAEPGVGRKVGADMIACNSSFCPISFYGDMVLTTGYIIFLPKKKYQIDNYKKWGVLRAIDMDQKTTYYGVIPKSSINSFYGGLNSFSSTENNGKIVVAPMFSNEIQMIDVAKKKTKMFVAPTKYDKLIKPIGNLKDYQSFTLGQANKHFTSNYALIGLVYDKYRDVYYRFVRHPGNSIPMRCSIAVMDNTFRTLFYYDIPYDYSPGRYFVDKDGLLIANNNKYLKDNSKLIFDRFTLIKN